MKFSKYLSPIITSVVPLYHQVARRITKDHKGNQELRATLCLLRVSLCYCNKSVTNTNGKLCSWITKGFLIVLFAFGSLPTHAQNFTRTITKTAEFANQSDAGNKFRLMNINGSVTIEAYDGDTIELTVNEEIKGSSSEIEKAKGELEYKLERRGNLILAYLDAPFITLRTDADDNEIHYRMDRHDDDYRFSHDVHVKVPSGILLDGSTINKGKLTVIGSFKEVEASNVNGELELRDLTSKTDAHTVNGDITISYDRAPSEDSEYQTINGTIEVSMPDDLSADVYFKSMHGDLYTDFNNVKRMTPEVKKQTHTNRSEVTYQVEKISPLRIGRGGTKLHFEVLNGDVYLRKQS